MSSKKIEDIINKLEKIEKMFNEFQKDIDSGKLQKKLIRRIGKDVSDDLNKIYTRAVDIFYESYEPQFYERQYSLRKMFQISYDDNDVYMETGPELVENDWENVSDRLTQHRIGPEYIYNKMFEEGWHGGATPSEKLDSFERPYPSGYKMAYRTPVYHTLADGDDGYYILIRRFSLWSLRRVAKMSGSPSKIINSQLEKYKHNRKNFSGNNLKDRVVSGVKDVFGEYELFK